MIPYFPLRHLQLIAREPRKVISWKLPEWQITFEDGDSIARSSLFYPEFIIIVNSLIINVSAFRLKRPVRVVLTRSEDFKMIGTRHPYLVKYKVKLKTKICWNNDFYHIPKTWMLWYVIKLYWRLVSITTVTLWLCTWTCTVTVETQTSSHWW